MAITRLTDTDDSGAGTDGTIWNNARLQLLYDSIENEYGSRFRASAYNSAVQSINDSSATALTFNSEDYDVTGLHSTSSNTSRLTIPSGGAGLYLVIGQTVVAANATGARQLRLLKNGATIVDLNLRPGHASVDVALRVMAQVTLVATDYLEILLYQDSGGALNAGSANRYQASCLSAARLA